MKLNQPLFLASQSPRRRDILSQYKIPFTLIKNGLLIEPSYQDSQSFPEYVSSLSSLKAEASIASYEGMVMGVDTIVVSNNKVYGKPKDLNEARSFLSSFSCSQQKVLSAVTIIDTNDQKKASLIEENLVFFNELNEEMINENCARNQVLDKAGAYGIQDCLGTLISHYEGSYESIMGMPIKSLLQILKEYDMIEE